MRKLLDIRYTAYTVREDQPKTRDTVQCRGISMPACRIEFTGGSALSPLTPLSSRNDTTQDVNGDGYDDVMIGAHGDEPNGK